MGSGGAAGRNSSSSISNSAIVMKAVSQAAADEGRTSRQKAKDKRIFRRMMDVQTTAAANVDSDDIVWSDMRRDAEMECRKVSKQAFAMVNRKRQGPAFSLLYYTTTQSIHHRPCSLSLHHCSHTHRSLYYPVICIPPY